MTLRKKLIDTCITTFSAGGYALDGYKKNIYPSATILLGRNAFDYTESESRARNQSGSIEFDVIIETKSKASDEYVDIVSRASEVEEAVTEIILGLPKVSVERAGRYSAKFQEYRVHDTVFGFDDNTARILLQCECFYNILRS